MDGIIHQGRYRLALPVDSLNDAHSTIVQIGRVIVVGDFPLGLSGSNLDRGGSKLIEGGIDRLGRFVANEVHVFQIAGVSSFAVGKGVTIRSAVRVGRTNEDVLRPNPAYLRADAITQ